MGKATKALGFLSGVALAATPAWPLGLGLLSLFLWSLRPKRTNQPHERLSLAKRGPVVAAVFFLLALIAWVMGGQLSPLALGLAGVVVLTWPRLAGVLFAEVSPVEGSVLLRSRFLPFFWYSLSEAKVGSDELPRSIAHFTGDLLVRMDVPAVFILGRRFSLTRDGALSRLMIDLEKSADSVSCGIFPMDSRSSEKLLGRQMRPVKNSERGPGDFDMNAPALLLRVERGRVQRFACFDLEKEGPPRLPKPSWASSRSQHLLWDVLGTLGKRAPWPGPDSLSSFIESVRSTKGEPLGERMEEIDGSGESVRVRALGGEVVEVPRPSLGALIRIYP